MPRYAGHSSHKTLATWHAACDAVRDAAISSDGTAPMSAMALTLWSALMTMGDNLFNTISVPPLPGAGVFFETEMSVTDDPHFRSVSLSITYRKP